MKFFDIYLKPYKDHIYQSRLVGEHALYTIHQVGYSTWRPIEYASVLIIFSSEAS